MTRYAIGLGSNVGERLAHLRHAVAELRSVGDLTAISPIYETAPVGGPSQPPFLNAVAVLETRMQPSALLRELQAIEARAGRVRAERWGPRTLDLDIVASDADLVDEPDLQIPHPRAVERLFVLEPLASVWPDADLGGVSAVAARNRLDSQDVDELIGSWVDDSRSWLGTVLVGIQFLWFAAIGLVVFLDGSVPTQVDLGVVAGVASGVIGVALGLESSRRLGPGLTALPEPAMGGVFVESGPYSLARHPIYGGIVLFMVGVGLIFGSLWALALAAGLAGFFFVKTEYEERQLRLHYAAYRAYRRQVRRRLIPFVL